MHTNLPAYVVVLTSVFGGYEQNYDRIVGQTHLFSAAYAAIEQLVLPRGSKPLFYEK